MVDWERVVADLETLHRAASEIDGWDKQQVATFIQVGEWGLALDDIAYAYLKTGFAMPADLFLLFEKLAVEMEMEGDEDYEAVAQLRAEAKARLG